MMESVQPLLISAASGDGSPTQLSADKVFSLRHTNVTAGSKIRFSIKCGVVWFCLFHLRS